MLPTPSHWASLAIQPCWGVGVDDNLTIPAYFDASTILFNVTNYAERGYTTRQNIAQLINLINQGKMLKIVVFYTGAGDVLMHCNYAITRALNSHQEEQRLRQIVRNANAPKLYANLVQPFINFFQQFGKNRAHPGQQACSTDPKRARAVANMMMKNWQIAQQLVTANGGQFYAFLQPNLYVGKPAKAHVKLKNKQRRRGGELAIVYPLVRAKIAANPTDWMTDLAQAFDNKGPVYLDDVHITPAGNKIIAEKIREIVLKRSLGTL